MACRSTAILLGLGALLVGCQGTTRRQVRVGPRGPTPADPEEQTLALEMAAYRDAEPYRAPPWSGRDATAHGSAPAGMTREEVIRLIQELRRMGAYPMDAPGSGQAYRHHPGDVLDVAVHARPEFSGRLTVRGDGYLALPTVGELVAAAGSTPAQLRERIAGALSPKYLRVKPLVSVQLQRSSRRFFEVFGEVARPGRYLMGDRAVTVLTAVLAANGAAAIEALEGERPVGSAFAQTSHAAAADETRPVAAKASGLPWRFTAPNGLRPQLDQVVVITPDPNGRRRQVIDLTKVMAGHPSADALLRPGQIVFVPSAQDLQDRTSRGAKIVHGAPSKRLPTVEEIRGAFEGQVRRGEQP